jgi:RHH-type transcriptional regulator, rel operon repressor / antitoxin RelB
MGKLVSVRLSDDTSGKLDRLSAELNRNRTFIIKAALDRYFEEYADYHIALDRLRDKDDRIVTSRELRKSLGL